MSTSDPANGAARRADPMVAPDVIPTSARDHGFGTPAEDWAEARWGTGVEPPGALDVDAGPRMVIRTFGFVDLCGSTAFLESEGPRDAMETVTEFRQLVRDVSARRGVRVAKWLGDGAMLVGVQSGPVVATAVEICGRARGWRLQARAGVAVSAALLFDGDDYIGRGANFASRICDAAHPTETLCDVDCEAALPSWVQVRERRRVEVRGMGEHEVLVLAPADIEG